MTPDYAQRRRVAVAAAITLIAVPAVLLLDTGDDDTNEPLGTLVGSVVVDEPTSNDRNTPASDTDPMGTSPAAVLEVTVPPRVGDPATIAIPRLPDAVQGHASFSRSIRNPQSCQVAPAVGAPFGITVTITNLDNSQSVRCINNVGGPEPDEEIILHAEAFLKIGDLTDAPIPVQLTW